MKYVQSFIVASLLACVIYYVFILILIDAPVPAEYWVAEMITIKKELVKNYAGKNKIIIAGGSSTLFGIDAEYASRLLDMPVINFGLHAGLRLKKIFHEVSIVAEPGDVLILSLEPPYYMDLSLEPPYYIDNTKLNSWHVTNIIGWDRAAWKEMSYPEKFEFVSLVSPTLLGQMFISKFFIFFYPAIIADRLKASDNSLVLAKFRERTIPSVFGYSAYNLNSHGDMQRTEGSKYKGQGFNICKLNHMCDKTANNLMNFVDSMKKKGVRVYFSNTPYMASGVDKNEVRKSELSFQKEFSSIGCFIDKREDLEFDRKYFFNTSLHLNAEGRAMRTDLFINAIRKNVLSGAYNH